MNEIDYKVNFEHLKKWLIDNYEEISLEYDLYVFQIQEELKENLNNFNKKTNEEE